MYVRIEPSWQLILQKEFDQPYFQLLASFVKKEYQVNKIYPHPKNIFSAFDFCPIDQVKVVILGQDPYHGPNQAHGLCFSVQEGVRIPPSLLNIYKEIKSDIGKEIPSSGNLEHWAKQGVFLLNATLTVKAGQAGSHQNVGWETFTDEVIRKISEIKENVVFMLWGSYAQRKAELIDSNKHLILKAPHPSPLSAHRGFFGCRHFTLANQYLQEKGMEPIQW